MYAATSASNAAASIRRAPSRTISSINDPPVIAGDVGSGPASACPLSVTTVSMGVPFPSLVGARACLIPDSASSGGYASQNHPQVSSIALISGPRGLSPRWRTWNHALNWRTSQDQSFSYPQWTIVCSSCVPQLTDIEQDFILTLTDRYPRPVFSPQGPSLRELCVQALSSVQRGYDLLAPKFDHTPFRTPDGVLDETVRVLSEVGPFGSGLDVCCGTGAGLMVLRRLCHDGITGVDFSAGMLARARSAYPDATW